MVPIFLRFFIQTALFSKCRRIIFFGLKSNGISEKSTHKRHSYPKITVATVTTLANSFAQLRKTGHRVGLFCTAENNKKGAASQSERQLPFSIQNSLNRSLISSSVCSPRSACSSTCIAFATAAFHSSAPIFPRTFLCFSRL